MNQRRYERVGFFCEVVLTMLGNGKPIPARSLDISMGGVGLLSPQSLPRGALVTVAFVMRDAAQKYVVEQVTGTVVNAWADLDGNHIGIEFAEPINQLAQPLLSRKLENI
jgi:hypothetical protein